MQRNVSKLYGIFGDCGILVGSKDWQPPLSIIMKDRILLILGERDGEHHSLSKPLGCEVQQPAGAVAVAIPAVVRACTGL